MLLVDSREKKNVINILKRFNVEFEVTALSVGDFVVAEKGLVIERKTIADFVNSMRNGHLQKQLLQMNQYENPYLLISGSFGSLFYKGIKGWTIEHHIGAIISCAVRYKAKVLWFENDHQLIRAVVKLMNKVEDGKTINLEQTELLKNNLSIDDVYVKVLTGFPRIGIKRAKKLLQKESIKKMLEKLSNEVGFNGINSS